MVRTASLVWRFFDKIEKSGRCVAVSCQLCEREYKFYGNTTNLKAHLVSKHPIQWQLSQEGTLSDTLRFDDDIEITDQSPASSSKKRKDSLKDSVEYFEAVDIEDEPLNIDDETTVTLVREMHDGEEWLEDQLENIGSYERKRKKGKFKIKQELQSPAHRVSYLPTSVHYEKPERYVIEESPKKDEFAVFGEYIGNKLRKFKSPHTRGNLQQMITTILWQAEYGMYDNPESVKKILLYSVQQTQTPENPVSKCETQVQCEEVIIQRED